MRRILLLCSFLSVVQLAAAQSVVPEEFEKTQRQIQTLYIYNFTKYFIWPLECNAGEFILGVLGESKILDEFTKMAQLKNVNGRHISVRKYASPADIEKDCHILYIPYEHSSGLSEVLNTVKGATLIISNKEGLGKFGSTVNFIAKDGKPVFEINMDAVEKRKLKCAQQLKSIAVLI